MRLWNVHDDPKNCLQSEERIWALVWADNEHDAKVLAASVYSGETCSLEGTVDESFVATDTTASLGIILLPSYEPDLPRVERDVAVQRLCGWREECESTCDTCGLAPNGMEEFAVCPECYQCKECGCDDDCPGKPVITEV